MSSFSHRKQSRFSSDVGPSTQTHRGLPGSFKTLRNTKRGKKGGMQRDLLDGPYHTERYIEQEHHKSPIPLKPPLNNFHQTVKGTLPMYVSEEGTVMDGNNPVRVWRTTVRIDIEPPIIGVGDHAEKNKSVALSALSAIYQLQELGVLDDPKKLIPSRTEVTEVTLSDGTVVHYEQARSFMDYYCRTFNFGQPEIDFVLARSGDWEAVMTVGGRRIGLGSGHSKKVAQTACYLDVTKYLESCDPELWKKYAEAAKTGKDLGLAPKVAFRVSFALEDSIADLSDDLRKSNLYRNRPSKNAVAPPEETPAAEAYNIRHGKNFQHILETKSNRLSEKRKAYLADPNLERMRSTRASLPVYTQAKEVLSHIENNDITICMAATGSGKTTQIPQMILDDYIERGEGANCNVICTQPRRLAAISVAHRVANERGEAVGQSVGYQVRFDAKHPEPDGSITFCTTGVFLKRLHTVLSGQDGKANFDKITHIIVDEVHERDVDTDLLLVVLKQILAQKKAKNQTLKIILMSATIDPTLFQRYFADESGNPAGVINVPGRSFPVAKYFMDDFAPKLLTGPMRWVVAEENVERYLFKELGQPEAMKLGVRPPKAEVRLDDLELPYPFIAATIAHVLETSDDGHVLVFLPGWEEIVATQKALQQPLGPLTVNFNSPKYSVHVLHSTIPLAEQQAIFDPPAPGVRRIILATNIAETSVTIPDVVYVIDTAKVKEQRYDPDRHMSSLVSAWVGTSNLNQRAGRAGRHRSGEYFGILSKSHAESLSPYQTVEMKRVDLSNVVMHVKALGLTGMTVEGVLAAAIEAPDPGRVHAAIKDLQMAGALDAEKNLTSLGRVLLQLPVDAQMGRLVLFGSFFRCLDNALTLAAILTNRDPFLSPMHLKEVAQQKKNSWTPEGFRSDALATLRAYNAWWAMQSRGEYISANRFCVDNFLSKPTLLLIQKVKGHLLASLYRAGVIEVSAGGQFSGSMNTDGAPRNLIVPSALNANGNSLPLLTALIAVACQPKFGVRSGVRTYRTSIDKNALIHPSSVNHRKREMDQTDVPPEEKQLLAFIDKRRNESLSTPGSSQTYLVTTTRLDPLSYILFGAYEVEVVERGLECDEWLPVVGEVRVLDDVQRLKKSMEACLLRVFEGITMSRQRRGHKLPVLPREEEDEFESGDEYLDKDYTLSSQEIKELDIMTREIVALLNRYNDERLASQSRQQRGSFSGYSTPNSFFRSRPGTPNRLPSRRP
ncbi:hypothetical protein CPB84DRAFT_1766707 [Gymnopilus junonius]|uniref:P-loop containing nucleoside triphosphate hydrolase protein n=1 Tax=Gymnopilus junonius TaxID=109634 RepID=A0A9P5NZE2_GYMJU|nr:hypothetical protein CPB84DRAFT_1766707 [Gymnopilus junonius]